MKLTLSFYRSRSPYFGPALELARASPGFKEETGRFPAYSVTFDTDNTSDMDLAYKLWHLVRAWKPSVAELDGLPLNGWRLERALIACRSKPAMWAFTLCFDCYWNGLPGCFDRVVRGECPQKGRFKTMRTVPEFLKQFEPPSPFDD